MAHIIDDIATDTCMCTAEILLHLIACVCVCVCVCVCCYVAIELKLFHFKHDIIEIETFLDDFFISFSMQVIMVHQLLLLQLLQMLK